MKVKKERMDKRRAAWDENERRREINFEEKMTMDEWIEENDERALRWQERMLKEEAEKLKNPQPEVVEPEGDFSAAEGPYVNGKNTPIPLTPEE
jgi:hypothetical protein